MPDIIKDFQDKYHPCSNCCLRICCTSYCDPRNVYHGILYRILEKHFDMSSNNFQFCFGKLALLHVSDYTAKRKMLLTFDFHVRRLSSKGLMFKMIINEIIKKIEDGS